MLMRYMTRHVGNDALAPSLIRVGVDIWLLVLVVSRSTRTAARPVDSERTILACSSVAPYPGTSPDGRRWCCH